MSDATAPIYDQIPARLPGAECVTIGETIILYQPTRTRALYLNSSAALVWSLCDGVRPVREIVGLIEAAFEDTGAGMTAEVLEALKELGDSGALTLA